VYPDPLVNPEHRICLPAEGALSGIAADLNGYGYEDLGIANFHSGMVKELNASIYFGISSAFKLPDGAKVRTVRWEVDVPAKTGLKAQVRFAATKELLSSSPWQGPCGDGGWFENAQVAENLRQTGPWIQYRLALGAINAGRTPRVHAVEVEYAL